MQTHLLKVNKTRIEKHLENFSTFGQTKDGGVTRLALTKEDKQARDYFYNYCKDLGLSMKVDDLGNIYAVLSGTSDKSPIVIGSHLDSVKKGGKYDGVLGVVAGIEVVETLIESNIKPKRPIKVVNFTNEEGVRFAPAMMSSGVLAGKYKTDDIIKTKDDEGVRFIDALKQINYHGSIDNRLQHAKAFIELHIEQGPVLNKESVSIGVVECVVGMTCYEINIFGESNHAGTTPMDGRNDALFIANDLIQELRKKISNIDKKLVYTIGRFDVRPNLHTVIPNKVSFILEARHQDNEVIKTVENVINNTIKKPSYQSKKINANKVWGRETVWFDKELCNLVEKSVLNLDFSYKKTVSGAGHDAQFIAKYIPTTMIFVPSTDGKSHTESEYTSLENCTKGVNVLLHTVIQLSK